MPTYNHQRAGSQQPTPPTTSRPWPGYQMDAPCSQSASPIALQPPTSDLLEMHGMDAAHSPGDHGHMVSEPHFSWGQYTVSSTEGPEDMPPQLTHSLYSVPSVAPTDLVRPSLTLHPSNMPLPAPSQVPVLHHSPDPRDLGPSVTPIDSMHHHFPHMMHQPQVMFDFTSHRRKPTKSRNRQSGRVTKRTRPQPKRINNPEFMDPQLASIGDGSSTTKIPYRNIRLRDDAPEKDKYILQLRCELDGEKGKGIWEEITKKYEERYGKRRQESLQMNLTRAVLKYAIWPEEEVSHRLCARISISSTNDKIGFANSMYRTRL